MMCVSVCKIICILKSYILSYILCNSGDQKSKYYGLAFADHRTVEFKCCLQPRTETPSAQLIFMQVL